MKKNKVNDTAILFKLNPESLKLIKRMQRILKKSEEQVISEALKYYFKQHEILNKQNKMKKLLISLSLCMIFVSGIYSQQPVWVWQNPLPTGYDLNSVFFTNSFSGFIGGNNGSFFRTTNGGNNWISVNAGITDDIKSIFFTDANTGYAGVGRFSCYIYKTTNGGLNWTSQNLGLPYGPRSIHFINANTGVAAYNSTSILLTTNAGSNWQQIPTSISYNNAVWAASGTTFYSAGSSSVSKTTNGGINWQTQNLGSGDILSICFTDSLNGMLCGRLGLLMRTTNGGTNWDNINIGTYTDINFIRYVNPLIVFASGQGGAVYKSTNGGLNWTYFYPPEAYFNNLLCVNALNPNEIFISGAFGTICKSTNSGSNWMQLFNAINNDLFYSFFIDDNNAFAASFNSVIKTSNGGANWVKLTSTPVGGPLYFIDANTGFLAAHSAGIMYKTTNGGINFTNIISGYPTTFRAFAFINPNTGFVVTSNAKILKTTNGGNNWFQTDSTINAYYTDILFTDSLIGYISGLKTSPNASLIMKTTNGGNSWFEQTISSTLAINTLYFVNNNTGFASSANSGQNFFKTTNGGANWVAGTPVTPYINDLSFVNANIGYACTPFGGFYRTTNGGNNWIQLNASVDNNIRSLYHNNNTAITYLIGSGGMILKSTNGSITGFEQSVSNNPDNFSLSQNYPNPFNPVTVIRFNVKNAALVKITVFDIQGGVVEILVNEKLSPGTYEVDFDGSRYSSGIYFYRFNTDGFTETKKMILIK